MNHIDPPMGFDLDSALAPAPDAAPPAMRLVIRRQIKSGLIGGKKFELTAKVESEHDLVAMFKGFPDELVLAFRSTFVDRSIALKRSELVRGTRLSAGSLNEMIEIEERLQMGYEQLKRMVAIVEAGDAEVSIP
jgi:hypothetical protein